MELWDVYDENRVLTGRTHVRGKAMEPGDYHLIVLVWIQNAEGLFLCSKRSADKYPFPGYWENTGGSALTGEDSLTAIMRETKEELGLELDPAKGRLYRTMRKKDFFCDVWHFRQEADLDKLVFQPEETCDARWLSDDEIRSMLKSGEFLPTLDYVDDFFKDARRGE